MAIAASDVRKPEICPMHTFLFCAVKDGTSISEILGTGCRVMKRIFRSLEFDCDYAVHNLPEINGGFFQAIPKSGKTRLIQHYIDEKIGVILFGEIYRDNGDDGIERIKVAWENGGIDAVREIDGCFSTLIVDRGAREVHVASDLIGFRSLRLYCRDNLLLVSPHEVAIVATGRCPIAFSPTSTGSILTYGWSLGGRSLLEDIDSCNPHGYVTWKNGALENKVHPILMGGGRIEREDQRNVNACLDQMVAHMANITRFYCMDEPRVHIDLTAGIDTRAVLAIALACVRRPNLTAFTSYSDASRFEVQAAEKLASKFGVRHESKRYPDRIEFGTFVENCRRWAFLTNGDTNGKKALVPPIFTDMPMLNGLAGAIYKGKYYTVISKPELLRPLTADDLVERLENRFPLCRRVPWVSEELPAGIRASLKTIIDFYAGISPLGADVLDLFHIYEHIARWGGANFSRRIYQPRRFCPFDSPRLLTLGFQLPAPLSNELVLHKTIIKKFLPSVYFYPHNQTKMLPFVGASISKRLMADLFKRTLGCYRRLQSVFGEKQQGTAVYPSRAENFVHLLIGGLRDLILEQNSVASLVLNKSQLEKMIDDHIAGTRNNVEIFAFLSVMETYRQMLAEAAQLAIQVDGTGSV